MWLCGHHPVYQINSTYHSSGGKMEISEPIIGLLGLAVLMIIMFTRMWIGFAMIVVGFFGFAIIGGFIPALKILAIVPYNTLSNATFSTMPLFMLMGIIIAKTGLGEDLYRATNVWMGQQKGGLAIATTVACSAFAAVSGGSMAAAVTLGKAAVPEMQKLKYSESLATSCIAAGSTLGVLIPPSMGFIFYSILTDESVGPLFMAGILPGILLTLLFILVIIVVTKINPDMAPVGPKTTMKKKLVSSKYTWPIVLLFLVIMGGIYGGVFTPTEAASVGAFGSIVIAMMCRKMTVRIFIDSLFETMQTLGMITIIIVGSFILIRFMTITDLPAVIATYVTQLSLSRYLILAAIVITYVILGMFFDVMSAIAVTVPILHPVILALGFDPIWYGVVIVLVMEMGMVTPPIGMNVFILSGVTEIPSTVIFKGIWPFVVAMIICVIIITIFPQVALFIPSMMR
jgi:tripartite ATP-independent transporter DctM subunit